MRFPRRVTEDTCPVGIVEGQEGQDKRPGRKEKGGRRERKQIQVPAPPPRRYAPVRAPGPAPGTRYRVRAHVHRVTPNLRDTRGCAGTGLQHAPGYEETKGLNYLRSKKDKKKKISGTFTSEWSDIVKTFACWCRVKVKVQVMRG
ncbi:hypothetical protein E2C01_002346 [Portunus trituberculatus]|uniref:Uncharacterized protein n=1 Tax=Portunus trituberculatus TaxID=210409 RepID=A0A5B7CJG5_PORTR|nr:hypothetical protein [Portunus trituberculatus]